jgi:ribosomal protein S14
LSEKTKMQENLQSLPCNSAPTRLHRPCFLTERPRANYRDFGLSGHILQEKVYARLLTGAQDPVGKDKVPFLSYLYGFLEWMIIEEPCDIMALGWDILAQGLIELIEYSYQ